MSKSAGNVSPENLSTSVQDIKNDAQERKEMVPPSKSYDEQARIKKIESIEKELDQILSDQDQNIKADDGLGFIRRKLKQVKSLLSQYAMQQSMEKRPSFSDLQGLDVPRKISDDWQKLRVEGHILNSPMMSNLLLTYDLLDIKMKICLLCFSVFPEEAIIKKRPLIYWWMAEGFIKKSEEKSAEEVGEEIFSKLMNMGIIQPRRKNDKTPIVDGCTVRPWIRRMLISTARKVEFLDFDEMGRITCSLNKSRRLCFPMDVKVSSRDNSWKRELSTVFNVNESYLSFKEDSLSKFEKLKILQLGRWQSSPYHHIEVENDEFLNDLRVLKHLKYLSLRGISRITALPSSISECRNLLLLDLKGCHTLERLHSDFGSLRKITHLDLSECYLLESMPYNLHKLLSLQVLKGVDAEKYPRSLSAFDQLKNLRKLGIILNTASDLKWLFSIQHLRILTLTWRMDSTKHVEASIQDEGEKAQTSDYPPLEKLDLRCFPFKERPIWLDPNILKNLKRLYIRGGRLAELIPNTKDYNGSLNWEVQILRLKHLNNLKLGSTQVRKKFPQLSYFEMISRHQNAAGDNEEIVRWKDQEGLERFPSF